MNLSFSLMRQKAYYLCMSQEACIIFKAGKTCDGYIDCADLCAQTEWAIKIFEDNFPSTSVAAFGFDNAAGYQKRAEDSLSAQNMPKFPKLWRPGK